MGQLISREHNNRTNDALVNNLIKRDFIQTMDVEKVFRCVDRGFFFTEQRNAYRDSAWQSDKVHLSAPCVYATVLECLELKPGNKFLNIGSGIGYFSTLAGLLLGVNGINHGVEIHQILIDMAYTLIGQFKSHSAAIDYYEFCEPVFIEGNACELLPMGYYDKVYCGAGVPPEESEFMKSLINIGGVLVMPLEGSLVKITREDEHTWKTDEVLEVSFTNLVIPDKCSFNTIKFPPVEPLSLQDLCRSSIRSLLRENLKKSSPDLTMHTLCLSNNVFPSANLNHDNPFNQFVRVQYGVSEEGLVSLRNIVESIAGLNDDSIPDLDSEDDEDEDEDEDEEGEEDLYDMTDNHESIFSNLVRMEEEEMLARDATEESVRCAHEESARLLMRQAIIEQNRNTEKTSDEPTKRKSPEAGASDQNKTLTETETESETDPENPKRMKMNKSRNSESVPSTSSLSASDFWETISSNTDSSVSSFSDLHDSNSCPSSRENDNNSNLNSSPTYPELGGVLFNPLSNVNSSEESDSSSENSEILYKFISEREKNALSKLLKVEIDALPVPNPIKAFLNYN